MKMKKIVMVTGAGGFIGNALCNRFLKQNYQVYGIDCNKNPSIIELEKNKDFIFIESSFEKYKTISISEDVDFFVHLAWMGVSGDSYSDFNAQFENIKGAINAYEMSKKNKCKRFLFVDSSHEYQKNTIEEREGFCSTYGAAKKSARIILETLSHNDCVDFYSVAFTNVFGKGDYSYRSTNLILSSLLNKGYADLIHGNHLHDWIYIDDAVEGIVSVINRGKPNVLYYIGHKQLMTFAEIVTKARNCVNPNAKLNFGAFGDSSFIDYNFFDLTILFKDTGFEPKISLEDGCLATIDWLKEIGRC